MVAISIGNGGGDAQGSERGLEYDTMSGRYAEFVETEVLPLVEAKCRVKLTRDPEGRATMGGSSGGSCALIMAWYHPELYHRVLTYSGTYVNQQWPYNPETPHGAWEFHEHLIPASPRKPIRIWMEVGDRDLLNPNVMRDGMHDWVTANENMAKVLSAKGYHYQFVFVRNASHTDRTVKQQTHLRLWNIFGRARGRGPRVKQFPNGCKHDNKLTERPKPPCMLRMACGKRSDFPIGRTEERFFAALKMTGSGAFFSTQVVPSTRRDLPERRPKRVEISMGNAMPTAVRASRPRPARLPEALAPRQ
jgi:hypothetical protein